MKPGDLVVFFPSPNKLLSVERRVLEDELECIRKGTVLQSKSFEQKRLNKTPPFVTENVKRRPGVSSSCIAERWRLELKSTINPSVRTEHVATSVHVS